MYSLALLGITAFVASFLLTPLVRNLFHRWGVLDHPGERTVHLNPVPRVGGTAIALACLIAFLLLVVLGFEGGSSRTG